jgi:hypothetical protein
LISKLFGGPSGSAAFVVMWLRSVTVMVLPSASVPWKWSVPVGKGPTKVIDWKRDYVDASFHLTSFRSQAILPRF